MSDGQARRGTLRILRIAGIPVYLHWSWAVVAVLELWWRQSAFGSVLFNAAEYLALFAIVLLHELGHALACRSVGGRADRILLWPLGGIAYVRPPQRPGAVLWSIAAGPLVNLVLAPLILAFAGLLVASGWAAIWPDLYSFVVVLGMLNLLIFTFNAIPVYPLDGGQILHAVLWFVLGRDRALMVAAVIGLVASSAGVLLALSMGGSLWLALIGAWMASRSILAIRMARARLEIEAAPPRPEARCPRCGEHAPTGAFWGCVNGHPYDAMASHGRCPTCGAQAMDSPCIYCGEVSDLAAWFEADERAG